MPKARTCYICGRMALITSYDLHVAKCAAIFEGQEALKPVKERRQLPKNPSRVLQNSVTLQSSDLERLNRESFLSTLVECQYCNRRFLPEKLIIHNKSCTDTNPAKRVSEKSISSFYRSSNTNQPEFAVSCYTVVNNSSFNEYATDDDYARQKCDSCGRFFSVVALSRFVYFSSTFNFYLFYRDSFIGIQRFALKVVRKDGKFMIHSKRA